MSHIAMLVEIPHDESPVHLDLLKSILEGFQEGLSDFMNQYGYLVAVERINPSANHRELRRRLEVAGITVWLTTEPNKGGHSEVFIEKGDNIQAGLAKLAQFERGMLVLHNKTISL
jgi:hypothetical protein